MNSPARQLVDDLVWTVNSPAFMDEIERPAPISADDIDVQLLTHTLGAPPRRVGHYFERLVGFWLEHVRGVEIVEAGRQVVEGGRTIGELDFVYRDGAELCHLEAAVKFYLHDPTRTGSHFPGPNTADDFETKAQRLFEHQLPMSARTHPDVSRRVPFVRGCLFVHPSVGPPVLEPARMAMGHERGTWIRADEWSLVVRAWPDARAVVLEKPFWLTPGDRHGESVDGLRFERDTRPTMVALVDGDGAMCHRVCVVGRRW